MQTSRKRITSVRQLEAAFGIIDSGIGVIVAEIAADHALNIAARKPVRRRATAPRVRKAA